MEKRYCPYCMTVLGEEDVCPACGRRVSEYDPAPIYLRPGTVLVDKYILGGVLREDDASITYIGRDLLLHKKVAVKEFFPKGQADRDAAQSPKVRGTADISGTLGAFEKGRFNFRREAQILAKMEKQSAIVDVQDLFDANETVYLVTELVTGSTLRQRVQASGPMAPDTLFPLLENVFVALEALHEQGLYHRAINPDNIVLERDNARLINFASARQTGGRETHTLSTATQAGFSALEQYYSGDQGPWTDVYGLSATIYFCLTGRTPPAAPDREDDDKLLSMLELDVPVSRTQNDAVITGMRVRRDDRLQSVAQLYDGIYKGIMPVTPVPPPPPPPPHPVSKKLILGLAALAAVAVIVAALFLTGVLPPEKAAPTPTPAATEKAEKPTPRPTATPKPTLAPGSGAVPDLKVFAGAALLPGGDRADLQALMDDETVPAVALPNGAVVDLDGNGDGPFTVTKPLWVEEGATLKAGDLVVSDKLVIDGVLECQGLVDLTGSGAKMAVNVPLPADTSDNMTVIMDRAVYLAMDQSLIDESLQSHLFVRPQEEKNILKVADADSLQEAVQNGGSVLLTESVTLPEDFKVENATLFIAEGVKVSGLLGRSDAHLTVGEGGVVVNRGEMMANTTVVGGVVYNYGSMHDIQGFFISEKSALFNFGSLEIRSGMLHEPARLVNSGEMSCRNLYVLGGRLVNVGLIEMPRTTFGFALTLRYGAMVYNAGTVHMQANSCVDNAGWIVNDGLLELDENARLDSNCAVYNRRGALIRGSLEQLNCYGGVLLDAGQIERPEEDTEPMGEAPLRADLYGVPASTDVHNAEELLAALNGETPVCLWGEVVLDQPLEITGQLYMGWGSSLSAPSVTVNGGLLVLLDSQLNTGDLTLQDRAEITMLGQASALDFTGALRMDQGTIYCPESDLNLSGRTVDLQDGSAVVMERGTLTADGAQITIGVGVIVPPYGTDFSARDLTIAVETGDITCPAPLSLTNAAITISNGAGIVAAGWTGELRDCTVTTNDGNLAFDCVQVSLTGATEIVNNGGVFISSSNPYIDTSLTADDTVRIVNNGEMDLCDYVPVEGNVPDYENMDGA